MQREKVLQNQEVLMVEGGGGKNRICNKKWPFFKLFNTYLLIVKFLIYEISEFLY